MTDPVVENKGDDKANPAAAKKKSVTTGADVQPLDAMLVTKILKSMGVEEYEPRVINQLLEFMYRYVTDVLQDANVYSDHAGKSDIDIEDIRLAIQSRVNFTFTQPPSREHLLELANKRNCMPLPVIPKRLGVLLPPEKFCLTSPTYQVNVKKPKPAEPAPASVQPPAATAANGAATPKPPVNKPPARQSANQIQIKIQPRAPAAPADDEDDYDAMEE
eukprot:GFYU01010533.1.p1 GENE.GFYU01010533.1~~GFYU01010533.1.p1  ORF type:complete len:218 (-),score=35.44 GFYU01010533.1:411-1064(-)